MLKDADLEAVGRRIAELRRLREQTQEMLAARLGVGMKYVQRVEHGSENLTLSTLTKIARALRVPLRELVAPPTVLAPRRGRPPKQLASARLDDPPFRPVSGDAEHGPAGEPAIPLLTAAAAACYDGEASRADVAAWVIPTSGHRWDRNMFVMRMIGRSMEPTIADGAFVLLRFATSVTGRGEIALVELRGQLRAEVGAAFVLKRVRVDEHGAQRSVVDPAGGLVGAAPRRVERDKRRAGGLVLRSDSPAFRDVSVVARADEAEPAARVIAAFVAVLGSAPAPSR